MILSSSLVHHSLLFEWKNGPNTESDQLRRYGAITAQDLVQRAMLRQDESLKHDVAIVGHEMHGAGLIKGVDASGFSFPVLLINPDGLRKAHSGFSEPTIDAVFGPTLQFDWNRVPSSFIPVDGDSSEAEYAALIMPRVLADMERGSVRVLADDVARSLLVLWDTANPHYRESIRKKITTVLNRAANREFHQFLRRDRAVEGRTHSPTWEIVENPLMNEPDKRQRIWKEMRRRQAQLIAHFQSQGQPDLPLEEHTDV